MRFKVQSSIVPSAEWCVVRLLTARGDLLFFIIIRGYAFCAACKVLHLQLHLYYYIDLALSCAHRNLGWFLAMSSVLLPNVDIQETVIHFNLRESLGLLLRVPIETTDTNSSYLNSHAF